MPIIKRSRHRIFLSLIGTIVSSLGKNLTDCF